MRNKSIKLEKFLQSQQHQLKSLTRQIDDINFQCENMNKEYIEILHRLKMLKTSNQLTDQETRDSLQTLQCTISNIKSQLLQNQNQLKLKLNAINQ